jgi:uncharacterized protein YbaR (Trm112 family)
MSVLRSLRNLWRQLSFARYHKIPSDAVVVDVGCGNIPNMRSNILADKFLEDNSERPHPLLLDHRPFVVCDALSLPFKDGTVDYVICSHLAEHLESPEELFGELSRVAKAGYIECPGRIREILHGWEFHRWYVQVQGDRMVFEEKPRALHDPELHEWFVYRFEHDPQFERFFVDNMERLGGLVAAYDWVGEINYSVQRITNNVWQRTRAKLRNYKPITLDELSNQLKRVPPPPSTLNARIKTLISKAGRRVSDRRARERLRSMLCCPKCRGDLSESPGNFRCLACEADFPIVGNVYYLVPEQVEVRMPAAFAQS